MLNSMQVQKEKATRAGFLHSFLFFDVGAGAIVFDWHDGARLICSIRVVLMDDHICM